MRHNKFTILRNIGLITGVLLLGSAFLNAQSGPAGVGNASGANDQPLNALWVKADGLNYSDGDSVTAWPDVSGNGNDLSLAPVGPAGTGAAENGPIFRSNRLNGQPWVAFTDSAALGRTDANCSNLENQPGLAMYVVFKRDTLNDSWENLINKGPDDNFTLRILDRYDNMKGSAHRQTWDQNFIDHELDTTNPYLFSANYNQVFGRTNRLNGGEYDTTVNNPGDGQTSDNGDPLRLGGETEPWHVYNMAEVIVYTDTVNSAQNLIIENYLAAKYDLSITDDYYTGDESVKGDYDYEVSGIGKAGQVNNIPAGAHVSGNSGGFYIDTSGNTLDLGEGLMYGHDGTPNTTANLNSGSEVTNSGAEVAWGRNWYVDTITTDGIDVKMSFKVLEAFEGLSSFTAGNAADYVLLHKTSGDYSIVDTATSVMGDTIVFDEVTNSELAEGYYTLGTVDLSNSPIGEKTYYVSPGGANTTGLSWDSAFTELTTALSKVNSGEIIYVEAGTYTPVGNRDTSFVIPDSVKIYGHFEGTEFSIGERKLDSSTYETILSGDIGVVGDASDNNYHVVLFKDVSSETVLDGFTISHGYADGADTLKDGAGIFNYAASGESSPQVANCKLAYNRAFHFGGGVYNYAAGGDIHATFTNCTFTMDTAGQGAAVMNLGEGQTVSPVYTNCEFKSNIAMNIGSVFDNADAGGQATSHYKQCIISGNQTFDDPAAGWDGHGGGAYHYTSNSGSINTSFVNCLISGNKTVNSGGGYGAYNSGAGISSSFMNCTFTGNNAGGSGSAIQTNETATLTNTIVWGNSTYGGSQINAGTLDASYSDIPGGSGSNIDADPQFFKTVDTANAPTTAGDLRLIEGSPAIDTGTSTNAPAEDIKGNTRDDNPDMGAYEEVIPVPDAIDTIPAAGATGVALTTVPYVIFDQPVDSADFSGIMIQDTNGNAITNTPELNGDTLFINHTGLDSNNMEYTVIIPSKAVKNAYEMTNDSISWSFTTIMAAPLATDTVPADGQTDVSTDANPYVIFDQMIDSADFSGIKIQDTIGNVIANTPEINGDTLFINHSGLDSINMEYTVMVPVGAVENMDQVGNDSISWSFTSISAPMTTDTIPADGQTDVSMDANPYVIFDQMIDSADFSGIKIQDTIGNVIANTPEINGDTLFINHSGLDSGNMEYKVMIPAGAVENTDQVGNDSISWSFTTHMAPPMATDTVPADGQTGVSTDANTYVIFDQMIDSADFSGIKIEDSGGNEVSTSPELVSDTLWMNHSGLGQNNEDYTVTIPAGAVENTDQVGNESITWSFTTIMAAPMATDTVPADGQTGVALDTSIYVIFDQTIDSADFSGIKIEDSGGNEVSTSPEVVSDTLWMNHSGLGQNNEEYTVTIPAGAVENTDQVGNDSVTWSFTTIMAAPMATDTVPADGQMGVSTDANTYVIFDQMIDSADFSGIKIEDSGGNEVSTSPELVSDTLWMNHSGLDQNNEQYTVMIPAGAVKNAAKIGNDSIAWSFSTTNPPDSLAISPGNGADNVALDAGVSLRWDQTVDSVDVSGITITDSTGQAVSNVGASFIGTTMSITHDNFTKNNMEYTVTIPAGVVKNTNGVMNDSITWSFTTIMAAPMATDTVPADGQTGVSTDANPYVIFDQMIDSADFSGIKIEDSGGNEVPTSPEVVSDTLWMNHSGLAQNNEEYTVTIPAGAVENMDQVGNESIEWSFTTLITAAPMATDTVPADGQTGVSADAHTYVIFDHMVDSADFSGIKIEDSGGNEVSTSPEVVSDTLWINHSGLGQNNEEYTVIIPAGAVENAAKLANDSIAWSFTSIMAAPMATDTVPADGQTGVSMDASPYVIFDQMIDSADFSGIKIEDSGGNEVSTSPEVVSDTLWINHSGLGQNNEDYTVTIPAGAVENMDQVGNESIEWMFTTLSTSMDIPEDGNIEVYPVPSAGIIHIAGATGAQIKIVDILGNVVYNQTAENSVEKIDLSGQSGVYIVYVNNKTVRVVIQ